MRSDAALSLAVVLLAVAYGVAGVVPPERGIANGDGLTSERGLSGVEATTDAGALVSLGQGLQADEEDEGDGDDEENEEDEEDEGEDDDDDDDEGEDDDDEEDEDEEDEGEDDDDDEDEEDEDDGDDGDDDEDDEGEDADQDEDDGEGDSGNGILPDDIGPPDNIELPDDIGPPEDAGPPEDVDPDDATPTSTPTPSPEPTPSTTPSSDPTPNGTPTAEPTPNSTSTPTPTPTSTPTPTPTPSPPATAAPSGDSSSNRAAPQRDPTSTPESEARFDVSLASSLEESVAVGDLVRIVVRIENVGERNGTFEGDLTVDGEAVATDSVAVEAGGVETLAFEHRFDDPGQRRLGFGGSSLATMTVTAGGTGTDRTTGAGTGQSAGDGSGRIRVQRVETGPSAGTGPVAVVEASAPADWVRRGYETTVRVTVRNAADHQRTRTLTVTVDGRPVANATVTLAPDENATVPIDFRASEGQVAVEGVEAGRIDVGYSRGPETPPDDDGRSGAQFDPGLAVVLTIVGSLASAAVHVALRRR